jgi:hypothetical protein
MRLLLSAQTAKALKEEEEEEEEEAYVLKKEELNPNPIKQNMRCSDIEGRIWRVLTLKKLKETCKFKNNIDPLNPVEIICIYIYVSGVSNK